MLTQLQLRGNNYIGYLRDHSGFTHAIRAVQTHYGFDWLRETESYKKWKKENFFWRFKKFDGIKNVSLYEWQIFVRPYMGTWKDEIAAGSYRIYGPRDTKLKPDVNKIEEILWERGYIHYTGKQEKQRFRKE